MSSADKGVEMKLLGTDKVTLVDEDDFRRFNAFNWRPSENGYVLADSSKPRRALGAPVKVRLHRLVMAAPDGMDVDHINGDRLDNRKSNLRLCTRSENLRNQQVRAEGSYSNLKGAYWRPRVGKYEMKKKWFAAIQISRGKHRFLGSFYTAEEAHERYKEESLKVHGEYSVFKSQGKKGVA